MVEKSFGGLLLSQLSRQLNGQNNPDQRGKCAIYIEGNYIHQ